MKKLFALLLTLLLLASVTAMAEGNLIAATCMDGTNPFFVALEGSIREVVEANGEQQISLDPQNRNETQISQIEDMISRGIKVLFLNPVVREGITAGLDKLKEAGIPIFGFDTEVADMSYLVTYAGSDNYNAGYVCGVDLCEKCPEGGDIIILDSPPCSPLWTAPTVSWRPSPIPAPLQRSVPARLHGQPGLGNLNGTDALTANPNAVAIFGGNDPRLGAFAAEAAVPPPDLRR